MKKHILKIVVFCLTIVFAFCSCGTEKTSSVLVEKDDVVNFKASEYVNNFDVFKRRDIIDGKNFDLNIEVVSLGSKNAAVVKKSIREHNLGNPAKLLPPLHCAEWGYSYYFLSGGTDGTGREIKSFDWDSPPENKKEAISDLKEFLFRQYSLPEKGKWWSMPCFYNWQHYSCEFGAKIILREHGENANSYQMGNAFNRGAARQYNIPWGIDFSSWYQGFMRDFSTNGIWETGGLNNGHSLNLMERTFVETYMSGASYIIAEAGGSLSFYDDFDEENASVYRLTPYGEICQKFYKFTQDNNDIGYCYTPFALVLDYYHGMNPNYADDIKWATHIKDKSFGVFDYTDGDYMTKSILSDIYGEGFITDIYSFNTEAKRLNNNKISDSFDVLLQNASQTVLDSYKALLLTGDIKFKDEEITRYKEYAENGGVLILNTAYLDNFPEYLEKYDGSQRCDINVGKGKVIVYGEDYNAEQIMPIIEELYSKYSPITISGDVQTVLSVKDNALFVTLINNKGVTKNGDTEEIIDANVNDTISVKFNGKQRIKSVSDIYNDNTITQNGNEATVTLSAGDIAVLKFSF